VSGEGKGIMKASKTNRYGYNSALKGLARANRKNMNKAEACMWKYVLRARQMRGFGFRRQRPVLHYIADFMCKELMLIIEVDGFTHEDPDVKKNDHVRQRCLEDAGFTVLRFTNEEVLESINEVKLKIENWIDSGKSVKSLIQTKDDILIITAK
jgi:very-short-patch-repair endonuclease